MPSRKTHQTQLFICIFDKLVETTTIPKGLESCCTYKYDQSSKSMNDIFFSFKVWYLNLSCVSKGVSISVLWLLKIPNNSQENTEELTFNLNVKEYVNHKWTDEWDSWMDWKQEKYSWWKLWSVFVYYYQGFFALIV